MTTLSLPTQGLSRWKQFQPFCPFSKEKWRQLVLEGKAPQPIKLGARCTMYRNEELHKFFESPLDYRA
ncbi:hypothetical protein GCM10009007_00240 [Formosimonas limnophila]|uniref:Uncharacterized protein n=1 Tax=Formosimonas limnophila TaxID=1384487 RepID=A0A8J3CF18_9BURK|nr:transcriptional regulator [Formosimonas limnophila]GHA63893.1 hypothetical protein GCM10009007_00240 [Formosimonas limnophila]